MLKREKSNPQHNKCWKIAFHHTVKLNKMKETIKKKDKLLILKERLTVGDALMTRKTDYFLCDQVNILPLRSVVKYLFILLITKKRCYY